MSRRILTCCILLAVFAASFTTSSVAQDPDDLQQGIKAYGTYRGGEFDSVSMTNGNLTLDIPLVSYPQRGKVKLGFRIVYNGKNYKQRTRCLAEDCTTYVELRPGSSPPLKIVGEGFREVTRTSVQYIGGGSFISQSLVSFDGASHQLGQFSSTSSTEYESVDATGLHVGSSGIFDGDGTRYQLNSQQEDANGNQLTTLDTVGRTIPYPPGPSSGAGNCPSGPLQVTQSAQWILPGPNGGSSTFLLCWVPVNIVTSYAFGADPGQTIRNLAFLQSVVLPNGTAWTFQYSNDGHGDLTQITLPTGGTISYVWTDGFECTGLLVPPRWLTSRTVNANDGSGSHSWTYSYSYPGGGQIGNSGTATVVDPLGSNTVYTNSFLSFCSAYTTSVKYYQGAVQPANLLKTVSTTYSSSPSPFAEDYGISTMNIVPAQITTTWANGKTSMVTKSYDSGFTFVDPRGNGRTFTGIYGKVTVEKEYDYGNGQPGPLLRQTNTSYAWQSPSPHYSNYLNNNMLNLLYSTQITDGTNQKAYTQYGYDETATVASGLGSTQNLDTPVWTGVYRGNQTSVNRWRNLPTVQTISSTTTYYDTGMPSVAKDPLLNPTTHIYSATFQDAYVTQVTNALNQNVYFNYDYNTGLKTSTTDLNGQVTSQSYDTTWRLTNVTRPSGGGQTSFCYTDLNAANCTNGTLSFQVVITKDIAVGSPNKTETMIASVDGLGRLAHSQLNSDPEGIDYTDDAYDAVGNKATTTNPYRTTADTTYGITSNAYDALRRVTRVTQADGSLLKTAYCGNTTLVTDEAGHWRRSTVDGLGRLIEVDEPNSPTASVNSNGCPGSGEPIWVTTYGYDTLGNLTSVLQAGSRPRSFTYDSLLRLLSANNPESGNLAYTYDANGNVTTKLTPLQNQTGSQTVTLTYCYDALNRLTAKGSGSSQQTCTNGTMPNPVATYSYDGSSCLGQASCYNIKHRTGMTDAAGSESWAYDAMGRVEVQSRTTNNITKTTSYTYNLDSSIATLTYPSGRVINYTPDTAGRLSNARDNTTGVFYATGNCPNGVGSGTSANGACYAPQGALAQLQNGSSLISTHIYNNRLQPCWMYSTTGTALATNHLCTDTSTAANMLDLKYNFNLGSDDGNLISITNNRVSLRSQSFTYDQLNRVATAQTTATYSTGSQYCWGQLFSFDSTGNWSNLLSIAGVSSAYTGCTQGSLSVTVTTKNQISGDTYDAAGNLMTIPSSGANYAYNAENQLCNLGTNCNSAAYLYDGDGNRVMKTGSKIYWYSGSEVLDETDATGSVTNSSFNEYVFFGANRIARRDSSNNVFYYLTDQLGSSRVIVQGGQTSFCYDADFEPFGGEHVYTNTCPQNYRFTGKERDTESGLDNFGARYYASTTGRFMSPDWALKPVSVPYANFGDPQTLNLYTYVENSPLNRIDADGHQDGQSQSTVAFGNCFAHSTPCLPAANGGMEDEQKAKSNNGAQNKDKPKPKPKTKPTAPKNSRTDVVLYPAGGGKPLISNAVEWEMKWKAGRCSGTNCTQDKNLTITGVEIDDAKPLGPISDHPKKGEAYDYISLEPRTITQWWSLDGKQVQVLLPSGGLTWGVQIDVHGGITNPPSYSPAPSNEPPQ